MKFVKSKYASPWTGVVLKEWDKKRRKEGINPFRGYDKWKVFLVLVTHDKSGNKMRKRYLKTFSAGWMKIIESFDLSKINKDWFIFDPTIDITTVDGWNYYQKRKNH